jgi:hypothetical protein
MKKLLIIPVLFLISCANNEYRDCTVVYEYENGDRYESIMHTSYYDSKKINHTKENVIGYDKAGKEIKGTKTIDC